MSLAAENYYTQRAEAVGLPGIPEYLDGQPVALLPDAKELKLSDRSTDGTYGKVVETLGKVIASSHEIVWRGYAAGAEYDEWAHTQRLADYTGKVIQSRMTGPYVTGYFSSLHVEAVSLDEVSNPMRNQLVGRNRKTPEEAAELLAGSAYFVLTAILESGSARHRSALITTVRPGHHHRKTRSNALFNYPSMLLVDETTPDTLLSPDFTQEFKAHDPGAIGNLRARSSSGLTPRSPKAY